MLRALVTGGSRGIGKAIVEELVSEGYHVTFTFRSKEKEAFEIASSLGIDKVNPLRCDICSHEDVDQLFEKVCGDGSAIDLIVNNAGISKDNYFAMMSMDTFKSVIDTNLIGTALISKRFIKKMVAKKSGTIINISSIAGILGTEGQTNYAASKGGINAFSKSLAREMGKYNIRIISVAPGFVNTDMYGKVPNQMKKKQAEGVSLKRAAEPKEIASVVSFLASPKASYITGTTIVVDGGLS